MVIIGALLGHAFLNLSKDVRYHRRWLRSDIWLELIRCHCDFSEHEFSNLVIPIRQSHVISYDEDEGEEGHDSVCA